MADSHNRRTTARFLPSSTELWGAFDDVVSKARPLVEDGAAETAVRVVVMTVAGSRLSFADGASARAALAHDGDFPRTANAYLEQVVRTEHLGLALPGSPLAVTVFASFDVLQNGLGRLMASVDGSDRIKVEGTVAALERFVSMHGLSDADRKAVADGSQSGGARAVAPDARPSRRRPARRWLHNPWLVGIGVTVAGTVLATLLVRLTGIG